ncbi:hypothetical protein M446_1231 [Methylobacterium sp. 4-46]|uniref:hypothetical protein n=1 Tax=unclassified Methylobacterium TaxID=2615210 RepID=UPI000165C94C|nr:MULTISPECIES: hypothetical protein [Methylobacterium]ACA15755.1 hypothetical protein M446_1231 [Methylobacterium sp. 4-46]WFT81488.1 hypothetical protein QA634_06260 [Methylobacterium nodulans]
MEAETQVTALTAIIIGLSKAGCDTAEAAALLRDYETSLPNLRGQRWAIPAKGGQDP